MPKLAAAERAKNRAPIVLRFYPTATQRAATADLYGISDAADDETVLRWAQSVLKEALAAMQGAATRDSLRRLLLDGHTRATSPPTSQGEVVAG